MNELMKKWMILLLMVVLSVSGCGSTEDEVVEAVEKEMETTAAKPEKTYKLRLGHIMTETHPNGKGAVRFAELVIEKTDGNVLIEIFPDSELGNEKNIFNAVSIGTVDFAILGFGEPSKRYSPLLILDAPYIADDGKHYLRILNDPIVQDMFDEMTDVTDVRAIGPTYFGVRHLSTTEVSGTSPEDFRDLKIRTPDQPMFVSAIEAMGATPVPMPFPEVYVALEQGVLDGFENTPAIYASNKFYQVQKYLINTAHIIGGNCIYVSEQTMEKLPLEYQNAVVEAGKEAADYMSNLMFEEEAAYMQEITDKGVIFIEEVDREAFIEEAQTLYREYEQKWGEGLLEKIRAIE